MNLSDCELIIEKEVVYRSDRDYVAYMKKYGDMQMTREEIDLIIDSLADEKCDDFLAYLQELSEQSDD